MDSYIKLLDGYRKFQRRYQRNTRWREWAKDQQRPKIMMIACSDSRVNPAILTGAGLGEIFMINNIANLVPPYKQYGNSHHSTSAAIEYAITELKVEHIIIMSHSGCGGIRALLAGHDNDQSPDAPYSFIRPWMEIVHQAADFSASEESMLDKDILATVCEKRANIMSLNNLRSFPWVQDAMQANTLQVHAWHFDIASGILEEYNAKTEQFEELI